MGVTDDKMEFAFLMARHTNINLHNIKRLLRYGATHHLLAEYHSNGNCPHAHLSTQRGEEMCAKEMGIELKIVELLPDGCKPTFSDDPRGCTVKIQVPDGYTNDWRREGICVPTS